jgi:hypothetical protein
MGRQKGDLLSKNPEFNYTVFCLNGFKKTFPILCEVNPMRVAEWLYGTVSAFNGRDGRSLAGGSQSDIVAAVSAAAGIIIPIRSIDKPRQIKDTLRARLLSAWRGNDHATIMSVARGFERNASMTVIDHLAVSWVDPYRTVEEIDEEENEVPEAIKEWVEVFCEPSQVRLVIGNYSRKKLLSKPAERAVKSLFEGA